MTSLVKKIDEAAVKNGNAKMCSFVVFLNDDEALENKLKSFASKEGIKKTVLAIDNPAGPKKYQIAKDADVTVLFYKNKRVQANHAFRKGELKPENIEKVVADLSKILPSN